MKALLLVLFNLSPLFAETQSSNALDRALQQFDAEKPRFEAIPESPLGKNPHLQREEIKKTIVQCGAILNTNSKDLWQNLDCENVSKEALSFGISPSEIRTLFFLASSH